MERKTCIGNSAEEGAWLGFRENGDDAAFMFVAKLLSEESVVGQVNGSRK